MGKKIKWNKLAGIILSSGLLGYIVITAFIDGFRTGLSIISFILISMLLGSELSKLKE